MSIGAAVTLRQNGSKPRKVIACDENGYVTDRTPETHVDPGGLTIQIDETAAYTVVER